MAFLHLNDVSLVVLVRSLWCFLYSAFTLLFHIPHSTMLLVVFLLPMRMFLGMIFSAACNMDLTRQLCSSSIVLVLYFHCYCSLFLKLHPICSFYIKMPLNSSITKSFYVESNIPSLKLSKIYQSTYTGLSVNFNMMRIYTMYIYWHLKLKENAIVLQNKKIGYAFWNIELHAC